VPQTVATRIAPVVIAPPTRMTTGEDVAAPRPNSPGSFLFSEATAVTAVIRLYICPPLPHGFA
jgi:hypothetical protein